MANGDLIKGIDNNCEAVRAAMQRAERDGVVWPSAPAALIKGIDNNCGAVRAARRRAEENGVARPQAPPMRGIDNNCAAVRASVLRGAERPHVVVGGAAAPRRGVRSPDGSVRHPSQRSR